MLLACSFFTTILPPYKSNDEFETFFVKVKIWLRSSLCVWDCIFGEWGIASDCARFYGVVKCVTAGIWQDSHLKTRRWLTCPRIEHLIKHKSPSQEGGVGNISYSRKKRRPFDLLFCLLERSDKSPFTKGDLGGMSILFTQKEKAFDLLFCVNPPGLEPGTPTLKVLCSTC